jgi:hypothetical protein
MTNRIKFSILIMMTFCFTLALSTVSAEEFGRYSRIGFLAGPNSYTEIKLGYFNPSASGLKGGLLLGLESGSQVDEAVSLGFEINFWRKTFEKKIDVGVDTSIIHVPTTTTKVLYKHTVMYLPILATLKFNIPIGPESPVTPYLGASGGYAFAHIGYKFNDPSYAENGVTSSPDKGYYGGWNWRIFGGAGVALGSMSRLNLGLMYNGCTVSKSESGGIERELELNGLGFYASIMLMGI